MARLRYNGLAATLGAALAAGDTTITFTSALTHSGGTAVPTITGTDYIPLTILDPSGNVAEIVSLTAYTSGATTGTIARAQESTTATAHASGATVVHGLTVADVTTLASPTAAGVTYAGSTNLAAANVEAALDELDAEKGIVQSVVPGANVTVDNADPRNPVISASASSGATFRGEWATETLLYTQTFASTGVPPSPFVPSSAGGGADPVVASATGISGLSDGGAGATNALKFWITRNTASQSVASLDMTALALPASVSKIKFMEGIGFGGYNDHHFEFRVNGVAQVTQELRHDWLERTVTIDNNDTLQWFYRGTQATSETNNAELRIANLRVYGSVDPYMRDQYVIYRGRLYRSAIDANTSTPGADANWALVPIGYDQALPTTSRPTGITAGARIFDTTLGKPVWHNGTNWVDAAGASV